MKKMKKIGVLTSGGDAPGMNAAVRAVVRSAIYHDMEVVGIYRGYEGLLEKSFEDMNARSVAKILGEGGTTLHSARSKEFNTPKGVQKSVNNLREAGIEGLVCIGGDGTFRGARDLSVAGIPCIGVPATIDNDVSSTDYAIGFDTALNTIVDAVDKFRDTSESHDRCSVIEVMGRQAGDLALHAGIAGGAEAILTTEYDFDLQKDVIDRINTIRKTGKKNFIVIVAEGVTGRVEGKDGMDIFQLAEFIEAKTDVESRAAVLGHMQRGGRPTGRDRVLASAYGNRAVTLLKEGIGNRVVAEHCAEIVDYDILEALEMEKKHSPEMIQLAKEISI